MRRSADIDLNAVKSDWAYELAGFAEHPRALAWALQNLPEDHPPTVLQFRALARKAPLPAMPRLPEPEADPERVKAELAKMASRIDKSPGRVEKKDTDWAHKIVAKRARGETVSPTVFKMALYVALRNPKPPAQLEEEEN